MASARRRIPAWLGAIVLAGLMLGGGPSLLGGMGNPSHPVASGTATIPLRAASGAVAPPTAATGPGQFYESAILPKASPSQDACYGYTPGTCVNATTDPSINLTSSGMLAVAYTSYSNTTTCPYAQSVVAVVTSTDGGSSWSSPAYLDGPNCGNSSFFNSSWEPSLTSLANGTLVIAYIQYNLSDIDTGYGYTPYPPDLEFYGSYEEETVSYDRLVVSESYNGGLNWTTPDILQENDNPTLDQLQSEAPIRPSITASGSTVYVAWTNMSTSPSASWDCGTVTSTPCTDGDSGLSNVEFAASFNGGQSWGSTTTLNPEINLGRAGMPAALNPAVTVLPDGEVVIAYIGNVTAWSPYCGSSYCQVWGIYPGYWGLVGGQLVAARSTDNGTNFSYALVPLNPSNESLWFINPSAGVTSSYGGIYDASSALVDPYPSMAYDSSTGQLFIGVVAGNLSQNASAKNLNGWTNDPGWNVAGAAFVTNSSNGGATWTPVRQVDPSLVQTSPPATLQSCFYLSGSPGGCTSQAMGAAALAISNGSLVIAFGYYDYGACAVDSYGTTECGMVQELVYTSDNNGTTFTGDGDAVQTPTVDDGLYAGESASAVGSGSHLWIAWTEPWCPDWNTTPCEWPQAGPDGPQVLVSQPFSGTGVTVQFQESGLPSWLTWSADLDGNIRSGVGSTTLSISGVPTADNLSWSVPTVVGPYGTLYSSTLSLYGPGYFAYNTLISVGFSPPFTGNVTIGFQARGLPSGYNWSVDFGGDTQSASSGGSVQFLGVPQNQMVTWTIGGGGNVSVAGVYGVRYNASSTSAASPTLFNVSETILLNFTEQFEFNLTTDPYWVDCTNPSATYGTCFDYQYGSNFNYNISLTGPGLPFREGVGNVTWIDAGGSATFAVTPAPGYCRFRQCTETNLSFEGWTGAVSTANLSFSVPVNSPTNETALFQVVGSCEINGRAGTSNPYSDCVTANYSLTFDESGLPQGTTWGATTSGAYNNELASGTSSTNSLTITAAANLGAVTYRLWSVPAAGGLSWIPTSATPESPVVLPGQGVIQVQYTLEDPNSTEFLTQVRETGLPNGTANFTLDLNNVSHPSNGSTLNLSISGGEYVVGAAPIYFANGTGFALENVTVVPDVTNWSEQESLAQPTVSMLLGGPSILYLGFTPVNFVSVQNGTGGAVVGSSSWVPFGQTITFSEIPQTGYGFAGWTGTGPGSVSGAAASIRVDPAGPVTEVAAFRPVAPLTFGLTVTVTGLPTGTLATIDLGGLAFSSSNATFLVTGLNGSYRVVVPDLVANASDQTRYVSTGVLTDLPEVGGVLTVIQNGSLTLEYGTQYAVALFVAGNGSVTPGVGSFWENAAGSFSTTASPLPGNRFVGWTGSGPGSSSSTDSNLTLNVIGPASEIASFVPTVVSTLTYTVTVQETGLPLGTDWSYSIGDTGRSGDTSTLAISGLTGALALAIPTVAGTTGSEYAPNVSAQDLTLTSNQTISIAFSGLYLVSISNSTGGSISGGTGGWLPAGSALTLTATPLTGWEFVGWSGSGPSSSNATSTTITLTVGNGPLAEQALFAPTAPAKQATSSSSGTGGLGIDLALLIVLLIVGILIAMVVARRPPARGETSSPAAEKSGEIVWTDPKEAAPAPWDDPAKSSPQAEADEEDEE
jgi:Divergent InlB B-repeat domain